MSLLLQTLFWVAMCGTVTSTIYCLMVMAAVVRFGVRKRREEPCGGDVFAGGERVEATPW